MDIADPVGESPLWDHPEVLHHLDTDLMYGFDLCMTERTLQNFMECVPPPETWKSKDAG